MPKLAPWQIVVLMAVVLVTALFAAGQALTMAWLSSFPERAAQLGELRAKFWVYSVIAVLLFIADVILAVRLLRRVNR